MSWRKLIGRAVAVLAFLMVIGIVGGYFYLTSNGFQQFAMRQIKEQTEQATGGRAQIGGFDFQPLRLTAHFYHLVVRDDEPATAPPLFAVDKLTVGLRFRTLIRHRITLSELLIEHPVVNLQVDRQGKSNIPNTPKNQSSGHTSLFDLAVGHLVITRGEINYNDRKTPLEADLHDLGSDVDFDSLVTRYQGSISYKDGHFHYGQYAPLPHSFSADFVATPTIFSLTSAVLTVASSTLAFRGDVTDYSNPKFAGTYDLHLHTQDFAALAPDVKPAGDFLSAGQIRYADESGQPLLRNLVLNGQIQSVGLSALMSGTSLELRNILGRYDLANGSLHARGLEAELLNGRISADAEVRNLDATPTARVQAVLHRISLQSAQQAWHRPELSRVAIESTVDGALQASWTGSIKTIQAHSDLVLHSTGPTSHRAETDIPVDGAIHASYDGRANVLTLRQTALRIPSTSVSADGELGNHSNLTIQAESSDLHQLSALASAFRPRGASTPAISGSAVFSANVQGRIQAPQISGRVTAQNLQIQGSEWKTAEVSLQANPSRIVLTKGTLSNAQHGTASFSASVGLRDWSYISSNPIQANLQIDQMLVTDLQHLAAVQFPVSGVLSAHVSVSGTQLNPKGSGSLAIANARAYGEPFKTLALNFHGENGSIVSKLDVVTEAGSAITDLTYTPGSKAYKIHIDAPAIVIQKLYAVRAKNLPLNGTVSATVTGQGTLDNPQLNAILQLPQLNVQQKSITGVKAELRIANQAADFSLDSQVAAAAVHGHGHVNLTGDYETDASLDTAAMPIEVLMATYANSVPAGLTGQTEFHATLKGPLKDKSRLEGHLTIPTLNASYQSLQIGAAGPIRADYSHSVVTLQPAEIRGTGTSFHVQGTIPLGGSAAPALTAQGTLDARVLRLVSSDLRSSGTVTLNVRTMGSAASPQVQGQIRLQDIALATTATPLGVDKLNGTLDLTSERVQISQLTAEVGGGQASVGGSIRYRPSVQFDIAMRGQSVRLRYPEGLRSLLNSNLTWTGDLQSSTVTGRVLIDSLSFTPDFDFATLGDQLGGDSSVPALPGFADTVNLRIAVQSTNGINATSSQVSLEGSANLNVIGTAANPVITGRADLTGGELFYRNVRYQLERGAITFDDPNQTSPVLNVSVATTVEQYNLTLNLRGPFNQLATSYVSDPPLATADIINLIARGKTSSELAGSSQSTDSILASQAASQFSSSVQKLAGISSLQIDPLLGGNNQNPSARLALQQRLTKNFLFTFSTDVTQPGQEIVQGDYQISKRWSVSVERDQVGGVSVDGRFHTKF